jgi:septum site-determining protein MinD
LGESFYFAIAGADRALLVTTPEPYALRDAQKIAEILERHDVSDSRLIINKLRVKHIDKGYSKNIDEVIDMICLPLIGVVPYDENITVYANRDISIMQNEKLMATQAYINIANRICKKSVPLLKIKKGLFW